MRYWLFLSVFLLVGENSPAAARRLSDFFGRRPPAPATTSAAEALPESSSAAPRKQPLPQPVAPDLETTQETRTGLSPAAAAAAGKSALTAHGVGSGADELIRFLEEGLSRAAAARMPEEPAEKCQLAIDAMAALAQQRSQKAVPVLTRIAATQLPKGVQELLEHDLSKTAPQSRGEFNQTALRLLQFNAATALGLIGDPSSLELVRAIYSQETNPGARIQHAITLACLGDTSGVDYLVQQVERLNRRESAAAAQAYRIITGQDFGYSENTPLRARRPKARQYRDWWQTNRQSFRVDQEQVLKRRLEPRTAVPYKPRNTRDLLKLAALYLDFSNSLGSRDAREKLRAAGRSINGELQRIAQDSMEELDVRMEAMNWYYEINRADARNLMLRLRRDENPEVVDKAMHLLEAIDEGNGAAGVVLDR